MNKGGCLTGRKKETPNGGCKIGRRNARTTRSGAKMAKPKAKAKTVKKFSDDVSDVKTKAPTIKKGTKIKPTFDTVKKVRKTRSDKGVKRTRTGALINKAKKRGRAPARPAPKMAKAKGRASMYDNAQANPIKKMRPAKGRASLYGNDSKYGM